MLRDTRPWVGVDAGIDVHIADRVCVGCCAHVTSSLAVSRDICSLLWRSWETADTPHLAAQSETHSSGVASKLLVSRARSGVQADLQDSSLVASPFIPGPAAIPPSAGPVRQPQAREG